MFLIKWAIDLEDCWNDSFFFSQILGCNFINWIRLPKCNMVNTYMVIWHTEFLLHNKNSITTTYHFKTEYITLFFKKTIKINSVLSGTTVFNWYVSDLSFLCILHRVRVKHCALGYSELHAWKYVNYREAGTTSSPN